MQLAASSTSYWIVGEACKRILLSLTVAEKRDAGLTLLPWTLHDKRPEVGELRQWITRRHTLAATDYVFDDKRGEGLAARWLAVPHHDRFTGIISQSELQALRSVSYRATNPRRFLHAKCACSKQISMTARDSGQPPASFRMRPKGGNNNKSQWRQQQVPWHPWHTWRSSLVPSFQPLVPTARFLSFSPTSSSSGL